MQTRAAIVGKHSPTGPYAAVIVRWPGLVSFFTLLPLAVLAIVYLAALSPTTDINESSFAIREHQSITNQEIWDSLSDAWLDVQKTTDFIPSIHKLMNLDLERHVGYSRIEFRAELLNPPDGGAMLPEFRLDNVLNINRLKILQELEQKIMALPSFRKMCFTNNVKYFMFNEGLAPECVPPSSILSYFFPGHDVGARGKTLLFAEDGSGPFKYPYDRAVDRMLANSDAGWYVDPDFTRANPIATAVRFQLVMGAPVHEDGHVVAEGRYRHLAQAVARDVLPVLDAVRTKDKSMSISAGGEAVSEALLLDSLEDEEVYIVAALVIAAVVVFMRTRQPLTSLCVAAEIAAIHWTSLLIYSLSKDDTLPFLAFSSVFFVSGLVVHMALSVSDAFRHSGIMATTGRRNTLSLEQRVSYTLRHSGITTSITIIATIVTLLGCVLTPFNGARDYAILLIIQLALLLYLSWSYNIAVVVVNHKRFSRNDRLIQRQKDIFEHAAALALRKQRRHPLLIEYFQYLESIAEGGCLYSQHLRQLSEGQKSRRKNVAKSQSIGRTITSAKGDFTSVFSPILSKRRMAVAAFDEHAFGDAPTGDAKYISSRMVPQPSIYRCPAASIFLKKDFSNSLPDAAELWRSSGSGSAPGRPEPSAANLADPKTNTIDSEANASDFPITTSDGSPESTTPLRCSTGPGPLDDLPPDVELAHSPSNSAPSLDTRQVASFRQKWSASAATVGLTVGGLTDYPATAIQLPFVSYCYTLSQEPLTAVVYGEQSSHAHSVHILDHSPDRQSRASSHTTQDVFAYMMQRWRQRDDKPRRFIIFGKRMNESRAEKDARVLAKVPNARRMTWLENKVAHLFVPFINKARWVTVVISLALIVAFSVISSTGDYQTSGPVQLARNDVLQRFASAAKYFIGTAPSCDTCSNFYSPFERFRTATTSDVAACPMSASWAGVGPGLYRDRCGTCLGEPSLCPNLSGMGPNGTCLGYWTGPSCNICGGPTGSVCTPNGTIIACDNYEYRIEYTTKPPILSDCGYCQHSTSSACLNRQATGSSDLVPAFVIMYSTGNYDLPVALLQGTCTLVDRMAPLRAGCPAHLMDSSLSFQDAVKALGLIEDVAFADNLHFAYMRMQVWVPSITKSDSNVAIKKAFEELEGQLASIAIPGLAFMVVSDDWLAASTAVAISTAMKFIVFLGLSITIAAVFSMTLSIRLTFLVVCCVGGTVACTIGVVVLAGWEFNALLLCCFPGIFAVPICHISHMALHYMDRLEEGQLQLFAREASTKEAVRTTMSRTLMTVLGACVAATIVCIPTAFSKVYAMYVVAMVMLISHLWSLLFACVLFPGVLCAMGPVTAARSVLISFVALVLCLVPIVAIAVCSNVASMSGVTIF